MKGNSIDFRDRLLAIERVTPSLKEHHQTEMKNMLERKLTGFRRSVWLVASLFGAASAVAFLAIAFFGPAELGASGRVALGVGALFGVAWAALGIRIFIRGVLDLRWDAGVYAALCWVLPVLLSTFMLVAAPEGVVGLRMIAASIVFLIGGAVFLLRHVVEQSELNTRQRLLEVELQLAELAEILKSKA
jgi:hypothetical protein